MLENHNLKAYKDNLFSTCEFVISWHFWFNRFPEWVGCSCEHISIKQKLKSKCYLWIRKVWEVWLRFFDIKMFDGKDVKDYDLEKFNKEYVNAINFLEKNLDLSWYKHWFEVTVFAECAKWEWVGFSGVVMALLVSWLYYLDWRISVDLLKDYEKFQNSIAFKEIKLLAHQCTWLANNPGTWPSFLTTLVKGSHPHVYLCDNKNELHYSDLQYLDEYYKDLSELFCVKWDKIKTLPLRWALIYTWQKVDLWFVSWQREFVKYANLEYQKWYEQQEFSQIDNWLKSWFEKSDYFELKVKNLNNMSINVLHAMENIYKKWAQNVYVHELIRVMNFINGLYNDIEQDFDITKDFENACIKNWVSLDTFWFCPILTNKYWWDYLVLFEDDSDLDTLIAVMDNMKNLYPDIRIRETYDFESPAKDGIVIEQDISSGIWNKNINDLFVLLDGEGTQKFVSYADINPVKEKWIFLDAVKNKVYINWKVLSSKDIKSATTTIELFYYLLKSSKKRVKNNELWPSSFSWQENQMISKIISPFISCVKREFGKDFPLTCSGSLREFYIVLWDTKIPIRLVKKY